MCLAKVTRIVTTPSKVVRNGWKTVELVDGVLCTSVVYHRLLRAKWMTAEPAARYSGTATHLAANDSTIYPAGFHVFANETDAKQHWSGSAGVVVPVEIREVLCRGMQDDGGLFEARQIPVLVARQMRIAAKAYDAAVKALTQSFAEEAE